MLVQAIVAMDEEDVTTVSVDAIVVLCCRERLKLGVAQSFGHNVTDVETVERKGNGQLVTVST